MELNISCVRSILLTVEKYETIYEPVSFDEEMHSYYKDYLDFCDIEQILYHVQYCIKAGLLADVSTTKAWGHISFNCCLEPFGHFLFGWWSVSSVNNKIHQCLRSCSFYSPLCHKQNYDYNADQQCHSITSFHILDITYVVIAEAIMEHTTINE